MKFVEIVLPEKIRIFINFAIKFCNSLVYQLTLFYIDQQQKSRKQKDNNAEM
jgi:hypothetical protein